MGLFDFLDPSKLLGGLGGGDSADSAKYLADKQYEIADQVQRREDRLFYIWEQHYRACEIALKDEICRLPVFTLFPFERSHEAIFDVQTAFWRTQPDIERDTFNNCGRLHCSLDNIVAVTQAGINVWAANAVMRADEELLPVRRQHRFEELARMSAFGHKAYFNSRGAEMAIGIYGQASAMALRQQNNTASALGYFLQRVVSYGSDAGWFGGQQAAQQASLSGQGGNETTFSSNHVALPDFTSNTAVAPQQDNSLGNSSSASTSTSYGTGTNYPN